MRLIPAPDGTEARKAPKDGPGRTRFEKPTVSGVVTAGVAILLTAAISVFFLVPSVFYIVPLPAEADAATLCLPGVGPLQRFRDDLRADDEERAHIHEDVHADQCREFGAAWYALRMTTAQGRLTLEAPALCAEVALLTRRRAEPQRLLDWTVETLATEYFEDGSVALQDIVVAVKGACAGVEDLKAQPSPSTPVGHVS
jgi:hypothetical protein